VVFNGRTNQKASEQGTITRSPRSANPRKFGGQKLTLGQAATLVVELRKDLRRGKFQFRSSASLLTVSHHFGHLGSHDGKSTKKCPRIVLASQSCF
jgi:hypothetical protein